MGWSHSHILWQYEFYVFKLQLGKAEILKSIIANFKSIDNRLKSAEVIRLIKSINVGNSSHLMINKASCHLHYLLLHA